MPHITLSFGRNSNSAETSGDLSALGVGLAAFIAWVFSAPFGMPMLLMRDNAFLASVSNDVTIAIHLAYICALAICLLWMGLTNQYFLRFYVGRNVLILSGILCIVGTAMLALCGLLDTANASTTIACLGSLLAGIGSGVLTCLWCTAFARYEFTTITLNSAFGMVIGLVISIALVNWIPAVISISIEIALVLITAIVLWHLTPIPYYRRREMPIFHALRVSRLKFLLQLGVPMFIFGISLWVIGSICIHSAFCTPDMAGNLLVGAACALCAILFITAVGLLKNEAHWDTLFRFMLPIVGIGMLGVTLFNSAYQLSAIFLLALGFSVFLTLLWVLFSDMAQEFRLSPIFVFGIGCGLLIAGVVVGSLITMRIGVYDEWTSLRWTGLAMASIICLMIAGAFMPRKRNVLRMLNTDFVEDATKLNQMVLDSAAAHGTATTDEQADAANPNHPDDFDMEDSETKLATTGSTDNLDSSESLNSSNETAAASKKPQRQKGSFYKRCTQIADQYLLSRRETEVLFLLAKGHKAVFIEEKLCVSKSTAKTHINHIYKKLNIHTQQELLTMVEDRPRPHTTSSTAESKMDADAAYLEEEVLYHGF
ncbi:LuxR family transcriptional regulator [Adlercreutzia sp. ZJ154]|uniref:LuxR family transcriptional regulator n=1 Tax=Adlercreutzia sp. ZJ154 TaxID=2709790 RepID=UPI0013E99F79|nr:LuxR family transcriptional regulator [Adlercreutzia sp. ZJ154]